MREEARSSVRSCGACSGSITCFNAMNCDRWQLCRRLRLLKRQASGSTEFVRRDESLLPRGQSITPWRRFEVSLLNSQLRTPTLSLWLSLSYLDRLAK